MEISTLSYADSGLLLLEANSRPGTEILKWFCLADRRGRYHFKWRRLLWLLKGNVLNRLIRVMMEDTIIKPTEKAMYLWVVIKRQINSLRTACIYCYSSSWEMCRIGESEQQDEMSIFESIPAFESMYLYSCQMLGRSMQRKIKAKFMGATIQYHMMQSR